MTLAFFFDILNFLIKNEKHIFFNGNDKAQSLLPQEMNCLSHFGLWQVINSILLTSLLFSYKRTGFRVNASERTRISTG